MKKIVIVMESLTNFVYILFNIYICFSSTFLSPDVSGLYSTRCTWIIFPLHISKTKVNNLNNFEEEGEDVL